MFKNNILKVRIVRGQMSKIFVNYLFRYKNDGMYYQKCIKVRAIVYVYVHFSKHFLVGTLVAIQIRSIYVSNKLGVFGGRFQDWHPFCKSPTLNECRRLCN